MDSFFSNYGESCVCVFWICSGGTGSSNKENMGILCRKGFNTNEVQGILMAEYGCSFGTGAEWN